MRMGKTVQVRLALGVEAENRKDRQAHKGRLQIGSVKGRQARTESPAKSLYAVGLVLARELRMSGSRNVRRLALVF